MLKDRLREARTAAKLSQAAVAEAVNMKQPSYQALESGKALNSKFLPAIAKVLGVDVYWLQTGNREDQVHDHRASERPFVPPAGTELVELIGEPIPVISWVQAGNWTPVMSSDLTNVIEWLPPFPGAGKNGFGLIVKGLSMSPVFRPNDRIVVNPTWQIDELNTGDLVVFSCDGDCEATFKELVAEGGRYWLRALNPEWPEKMMELDQSCRLVGKVVGRYTNF